jgi:tetratricopeptide (TPR) repeat protein
MPSEINQLLRQASQARREHRLNEAERDLIVAVAICRRTDVGNLARAVKALGQIQRDLGRFDAALRNYQEAADLYRARQDAVKLAHTVRHVGDILIEQGHPELAEPHYEEALTLYRAHAETPPLDLANAIRGVALLKSAADQTDESKALWQEARDLYSHLNVEAGVAECNERLNLLASRTR